MKRSGIFITVLLSLFMFQSLWNVAAAFCDHESTVISIQSQNSPHFGHHVALHCEQDQKQHQHVATENSAEQYFAANDFLNHLDDDHSDHLPSFASFMIVDAQQKTAQPKLIAYPESSFIDWKNLYQSPHLSLKNPPPVYSPL